MALVKFDKQAFLEAFEIGLPSYITKQFQDRLESKLNTIVEETYEEMRKELPDLITVKVMEFIRMDRHGSDIRVEVDLSSSNSQPQQKD